MNNLECITAGNFLFIEIILKKCSAFSRIVLHIHFHLHSAVFVDVLDHHVIVYIMCVYNQITPIGSACDLNLADSMHAVVSALQCHSLGKSSQINLLH